jgi:uncharacterized membrane protein YbhN (UPF0104 family)
VNYGVLTAYDALALRYAHQRVPYRKSALAAMAGYAFSIALGHAVVTGGAVRYRLYSAWGVPADAIARVIAFCGLAFWTGFVVLWGLVLVADPTAPAVGVPFPSPLLGALLLALFLGWLIVTLIRRRPVRIGGWSLETPDWRSTLAMAGVASADRRSSLRWSSGH